MIEILKASAGSGKTYNLAETYIRLLLENEDPFAYRHILAVTFTNKATDEMKRRILKELYTLSSDPEGSDYFSDFVPSIFPGPAELQKKAGNVLFNILHDYSAFAVSTIDRFFQRTLKAFSREIGQFSTYQVDLDVNALVRESVDRILDSLNESDRTMLDWLSDNAIEQLEQGHRFNLEGSLTEMANRLKSDEYRSVAEEHGIDQEKAYSRQNIKDLKEHCRKAVKECQGRLKDAAQAVEDAFKAVGLSSFDTSSGFIGKVMSKFLNLDPRKALPDLTEAFRNRCADYGKWFTKANQARYSCYENNLQPAVLSFIATYDKEAKAFNTARILLGQINDLMIAADLFTEFKALLKEKNVLSIDESNLLLKDIIDGSDAPFVYERLGVQFEHFLLDEFQDTSRVQWDNFRPLVANSDSEGFENLLVGDVKQSIYRWRGSDWKLMAKEVQEEFSEARLRNLDFNWRSARNIVSFNNDFFEYAARFLDSIYGRTGDISVSRIYGVEGDDPEKHTLAQKAKSDESQDGFVEAVFCDAEDELQQTLQAVQRAIDRGASPSDITVLVRLNAQGSEIAKFLMDNGFDVISEEALLLKSSLLVRKMVSLMSSVRNPEDTVGSYLAQQIGLDVSKLSYHSLLELCEMLLRKLHETEDKETLDGETQYMQSFMDYVQNYVSLNGNSLDDFLKTWNDEGTKPAVSSPSDANAISVMTIHKAKGLEFPYVIVPYSEKTSLSKERNCWTVPEVEGTALEGIGNVAFDVKLSGKSKSTLFENDYMEELLLQYIDNINTFYVALTRASKGLTIIGSADSVPEKDFAGILHAFLDERVDAGAQGGKLAFTREVLEEEGVAIFRAGTPYDFSKMKRKTEEITKLEPGFPSYPLNPGLEDQDSEDGSAGDVRERGRLKFTADSIDFFNDEVKARESARMNGTVLHDILSNVIVPSDLDKAVKDALDAGDIDEELAQESLRLLSEGIASHPEWFPESGAEILPEISLVDTDGRFYRPDRVVVREGKVTIIDYKFGEKESRYKRQVERYADIYRRMGYDEVSTAIWYVVSKEVE